MFERMEVSEQVYKWGTPYKILTRAESNRESHVRKRKGLEVSLPTNPKKGRAGKRKTKNIGHPSNAPIGEKKTCLFHGPGHYSKVLKVYYEKFSVQNPRKPTESHSGGKPKCGKVVEFDDNNQEFNTMGNHGDPIPRKKKEKKWLSKSARSKV